jgi:hypothetical protein
VSQIKVIVIDSEKQEVREQVIDNDLKSLQKLVGGYIECAFKPKKKTVLYVDEEGGFKNYRVGFTYNGAPSNVYLGSAVISTVDDEGEGVDVHMTVDEVRSRIIFHRG